MTFDNELFCNRLKALREVKGLNKYEMSIQSDIHYSYYCLIENGKKTPNFKAVISIANALNVDLTTLIGDKNDISDLDHKLKFKILSKLNLIRNTELLNSFLEFAIVLRTINKEGVKND